MFLTLPEAVAALALVKDVGGELAAIRGACSHLAELPSLVE